MKFLLAALLFVSFTTNAQTRLSSTFGTGSQSPIVTPAGVPLDARSYYCDTSNYKPLKKWYAFDSYAQATAWLTDAQKLPGVEQWIDSTFTSRVNGVKAGGKSVRFVYDANRVLQIADTGQTINTSNLKKIGVPVIFFMGESNSAGPNPLSQATSADLTAKNNALIYRISTGQFEPLKIGNNVLNIPVNQNSGSDSTLYGPQLEYAYLSANGTLPSKIYMVNIAHHGSTIEDLLSRYSSVRGYIKDALQKIIANGEVPVPQIYYSQAINNLGSSNNNADSTNWKANTLAYLKQARADIGFAPVFMTQFMSAYNGYNQSMVTLSQNPANFIYLIANTDGDLQAEGTHWNKTGQAKRADSAVALFNRIGGMSGYDYMVSKAFVNNLSTGGVPSDLTLSTLTIPRDENKVLVHLGGDQIGIVSKPFSTTSFAVPGGAGYDFIIKRQQGGPPLSAMANYDELLRVQNDGTYIRLGDFIYNSGTISPLKYYTAINQTPDGSTSTVLDFKRGTANTDPSYLKLTQGAPGTQITYSFDYDADGTGFKTGLKFTNGYLVSQLGMGLGTVTPNTSAVADFTSTTKGFLGPRMTTTQRTSISGPAEGLEVWDLTTHSKWAWNGTAWKEYTFNP